MNAFKGGQQLAPPIPPQAPAPPPVFGQTTAAKKPQRKSQSPTFLGSEMTPSSSNVSNKTLLGQ